MTLSLRRCFLFLFLVCALFVSARSVHAQVRDTVEVIASPGGSPYVCCYDLSVTNRHDTSIKISEFRVRLVSGRASLLAGQSDAPFNWVVLQDGREAVWSSNAASADIRSGRTTSGFRFCVRDTGVFRFVWETRTIDSLLTRDTLSYACRGIECDQAFFRDLPSALVCAFDIDVVAGNLENRTVNDFHIHPITPGVTLQTSAAQMPPGWVRIKSKSDTISWFTQNRALARDQFAEGFRFFLNAPTDSAIRLEYWSTNFGDILCRDTVTLRCGLTTRDSLRITRGGDSCCQDLRLKNTHQQNSPIDAFTIRMITVGTTISGGPVVPAQWTRSAFSASRDSIAFTKVTGLTTGDTALFRGLCFENASATSDTIRYRWTTYNKGIPISDGIASIICLRPLTRCDSVWVPRIDSTLPSSERCISLSLKNLNSRAATITRFVVKISNPGTARRIRSASPPPGWQLSSFGGDSVVYANGFLAPNGTSTPFGLCVNLGDSTSLDPLRISWTTSNGLGPICTGSVNVNAIITNDCDSVRATEVASTDTSQCCFTIRFLNRNGKSKTLDRVQIEVGLPVIFASAGAPAPWSVEAESFPSFDVAFSGGTVLPDASTPDFNFCLDMRQVPERPVVIPVIWRTFSGGAIVCVDTVRVVCTGQPGGSICDTVILISQDVRDSLCEYGFRAQNRHTPPSTINGVRFRITSGPGVFKSAEGKGSAAAWNNVAVASKSVLFRGGTLPTALSLDTFVVRVDSSNGVPVVIEKCTMIDDQTVCCSQQTVQCQTSGVELSVAPTGFQLYESRPNPFSSTTEIHYDLRVSQEVSLTVLDASGREVRRIDRGREEAGSYRIALDMGDLPSGLYFYTLRGGAETMTRQMVLVK